MIVVYTRAYNAETTLRKTIDCILNQTYKDICYVLLNNGSVDSTLDIMREYAKRDRRVVILSQSVNQVSFNSHMPALDFIINNFSEEDYFCNIDADDIYQPDFLEKMHAFAKENKLEFVFSGYNVLERDTGKLLERKSLPENLVMDNDKLPEFFMSYRRYTTDMWAKLFRVSLLQQYLSPEYFDTLKDKNHSQQNFIYDALKNSCRVGFLAQCLMDYYESNTSQKNMRMAGQVSLIQSRTIFAIMQSFLDHFRVEDDNIVARNNSYIYAIYGGYVKDLIAVIKVTNAMSLEKKITYLFNIFSYRVTKEMLALSAPEEFVSLRSEVKEELCCDVISFIQSQDGWERYEEKVEAIRGFMTECGIKLD